MRFGWAMAQTAYIGRRGNRYTIHFRAPGKEELQVITGSDLGAVVAQMGKVSGGKPVDMLPLKREGDYRPLGLLEELSLRLTLYAQSRWGEN